MTNGTWRWARLEEQLGIQQPALLGSDKGCVCVSKVNKYLAQLFRGPKAEIVQKSPGVKNTLSCQKATQMRRKDGLGARSSPVAAAAAGAAGAQLAALSLETQLSICRDYFKEATCRNVTSIQANYCSRC